MKRCLVCNAHHISKNTECPTCGFSPALVDGFCAYAPELAHAANGFNPLHFHDLYRLEEANFWFQSRNQLILWALGKYCPSFQSLLEVGCGTGFVLSGIAKQFPHVKLFGSELFTAGLHFAISRLPSVKFMQMDASNIPFREEFDVIGAFDVLEHIENDERVLTEMQAALNTQGYMLLTVPQHTWLWSPIDEYACHVRRYSISSLIKKIENAGFQIVRSTSFITTLLPLMMISRFVQKNLLDGKFDATRELQVAPWLNAFLRQALQFELLCIKKGFSFPAGGSRLIVAMKI